MDSAGLGFDFGATYHLDFPIGEGASGLVWRGINKLSGQPVAVKLLREELSSDAQIVSRFVTERTLLTSLCHPNVVRVEDLVAEGGRLGIVMEFVPGISLRELISREGTLSPSQAVAIISEVLLALQAAHEMNIVHRDVKPDNILLSNEFPAEGCSGLKLGDFGISKIVGDRSARTQMIGTPAYMSPELIEKGLALPAGDVYAAGIMLYEMCAGRTPYAGEGNSFSIANRHLTAQPPQIDGLDSDLWALILSMLEKSVQHRAQIPDLLDSLGSLGATLRDVPPLRVQASPESFVPATVLRPSSRQEGLSEENVPTEEVVGNSSGDEGKQSSPHPLELSEFTPSSKVTVLRSISLPAQDSAEEVGSSDDELSAWGRVIAWFGRVSRQQWIIFTSVVGTLVLLGLLIPFLRGSFTASHPESISVQSQEEDSPLPSGLIVQRFAKYDSQKQVIDYRIVYKTTKFPLLGSVFESLERGEGRCAQPKWENIVPVPNSVSQTSIEGPCAWSIPLERIELERPFEVRAKIPFIFEPGNEERQLDSWLRTNSARTNALLHDSEVKSTSYPLQRLMGLKMVVPSRVIQGSAIPVTLVGVWPDGENTLNPVYLSPAQGKATSVLTSITGSDNGLVRFSDRCSGAVAISPDGKNVTALHPGDCELDAIVGNYVLPSARVSIVGNNS
ncbi:serine/threonine protein kinase [Actinomycetaceae bacterium TAE3-ERU4]|nr:serine/threonine protein kinase [Actinomycetaceae bacterium TAE3-ERU4]